MDDGGLSAERDSDQPAVYMLATSTLPMNRRGFITRALSAISSQHVEGKKD